jgi:hypothetical protein
MAPFRQWCPSAIIGTATVYATASTNAMETYLQSRCSREAGDIPRTVGASKTVHIICLCGLLALVVDATTQAPLSVWAPSRAP